MYLSLYTEISLIWSGAIFDISSSDIISLSTTTKGLSFILGLSPLRPSSFLIFISTGANWFYYSRVCLQCRGGIVSLFNINAVGTKSWRLVIIFSFHFLLKASRSTAITGSRNKNLAKWIFALFIVFIIMILFLRMKIKVIGESKLAVAHYFQ